MPEAAEQSQTPVARAYAPEQRPQTAREKQLANLKPFKPGAEWTGAKGPFPVSVKQAKQLARERSLDAMQQLIGLMTCPDARVAIVAIMAVLDRGMGKVKEEPEEPAQSPMDVAQLTAAEREQLKALLTAAAMRRANGASSVEEVAQSDDTITEPAAEVLPPEGDGSDDG